MNIENLSKAEEELNAGDNLSHPFQAVPDEPFPVHELPEVMQDVLSSLEEAYKAPANLIACMQLGVISAALGKGIRLRTNHPDPTYGLLYQFISTLPGINKTTVLKWLTKPLLEKQKEVRVQQRIAVESQLALDSKSGGPPSKKSINNEIGKARKTLVVEHFSQEGLATTLTHNNEYLAVISSDCAGVVDDLKGTKSNGAFQGELLLKGYSGDPYDTNFKVADDEHLEEVRLSVLWAGTDETLRDFICDKRISSRGLLSRFLFAELHESIPKRDSSPRFIPEQIEVNWSRVVDELLSNFWNGDFPQEVQMSSSAISLIVAFDNERIDAQDYLVNYKSLPERWAENGLRIALILHCAKFGQSAAATELSAETMKSAIEILKWYIGREIEVLEDYNAESLQDEQIKSKLLNFLKINGPTSLRDLHRKNILKKSQRGYLNQWKVNGEVVSWNASKGSRESIYYALPGDSRIPSTKTT